MPRIPQTFINDLLDRTDIVDVIGGFLPLKKKGVHHWACCPFHQEKTASFSVHGERQFYKCFGCGVSGTALTFLMDQQRMTFVEAIEWLAGRAGMSVTYEGGPLSDSQQSAAQQRERILVALETAQVAFATTLAQTQGARARGYLEQRGLTTASIDQFGIGFAPDRWDAVQTLINNDELGEEAGLIVRSEAGRCYDRFRNRVMFPIRNRRGRVIGFGGRVMDASEPKYLNSPETPVFHKGQELYGLFEALRSTRNPKRFYVVEGYLDVISLHQVGVSEVVATLGTATSRDQLNVLFRQAPEVVCCFDGDAAGRKAAARVLEVALEIMTDDRRLAFVFLPEGEDPDSIAMKLGRDGWEKAVAARKSFADYLIESHSEGLDLRMLEHRANLSKRLEPLIGRLPGGVLRGLLKERVRKMVWGSRNTLNERSPAQPTRARPVAASLTLRALARLALAPATLKELPTEQLDNWIERIANLEGPGKHERELLLALLQVCREHAPDNFGEVLGLLSESLRGPMGRIVSQEFVDENIHPLDLLRQLQEQAEWRPRRYRNEPVTEAEVLARYEARKRRDESGEMD